MCCQAEAAALWGEYALEILPLFVLTVGCFMFVIEHLTLPGCLKPEPRTLEYVPIARFSNQRTICEGETRLRT